ncbi:phosphate ABC transporter substrate-binding protein [Tengunoibacter tsumagoiensis]|uniref:Phosphate-binding protein n=1 Tax=Tengunoibacter tsumagoiensis TaxID=2014871 RepID=A0A401ZTI9_9CHLR|nr:phosphate ABC transporter substrate-binding protein [Tengunoibacter tsumagoiensis]GCE10181.1 phosphate-binding protein [Tengunoibacter tsumagoiensis]
MSERKVQITYLPLSLTRGHSISCALLLGCLSFLLILSSCSTGVGQTEEVSGSLNIVGSTALQPLVSAAATLYMKQHPKVKIKVQGGGSKVGLDQVASEKVDIGDSDLYADPVSYPDPNLTDHIVCVIPFAMVTNPDVTISSNTLTPDQIVGIFTTRTITNWKDVGGPDLKIVPLARTKTSGTRDTFRKYVLGGRDESDLTTIDSSTDVRDTVAKTPGAISYLALSVINSSVHEVGINGFLPTQENISSGRYTFWAYEHMYTMKDTPLINDFLDYMISPPVQNAAENIHYIPISNMHLPTTNIPNNSGNSSIALVANEEVYSESRQ